ncbi:DUF721 domain-containing protein [Caulobacter sp. KR2-114]|uniref:DUF721 domain-containing protein n=1 Tax=Caulobacter sp. KR2-114 TaxID=3400912 RepID=UPI003C066B5A
MRRPLPTTEEAAQILGRKRSRPLPRPPPQAGRSLAPLIRELDKKFGQGADGLKARWSEIVGQAVARRTEPSKLVKPRTGGPATLEVRVEGPSAALIQHQAQDIMSRVNLFLGAGAVGKLRIIQGPLRGHVRAEAPNAAALRRKALPPLDAAKERDLHRDLAELPDGPLKAALTRLGREVLRRETRRS